MAPVIPRQGDDLTCGFRRIAKPAGEVAASRKARVEAAEPRLYQPRATAPAWRT
jgi:hypothetical protein